MAKKDVRQAYRNIPVHPTDHLLLGMKWAGITYVDATLPFSLRSAPVIFTAVADALQWIMQQQGVSWVWHYVDDFITLGAPSSSENVTMHRTCEEVGMPVEPEKDEGPATEITFLRLKLDTEKMEIRLPQEKLKSLEE